jgi:predicted RNA binding protein YcfA (HicA-like mRNA interferase family)
VQLSHAAKPGRVTLDMGARDIPMGTLRSIYRQAGWEW